MQAGEPLFSPSCPIKLKRKKKITLLLMSSLLSQDRLSSQREDAFSLVRQLRRHVRG